MNRRRNLIPNILLAIILTICLVGITWTYLYELGYCAEPPTEEAIAASNKRIEEYKKQIRKKLTDADITFDDMETGCKGKGNYYACVEIE